MDADESHGLRTLYVDFNSYFASVEQQERPELRGKPIGIIPVQAETTCCIAASYEAKRFGVKTGTLVRDARKLCPGIRFVQARPQRYIEFHQCLVAAVDSCVPVERVYSIDEMACSLAGSQRQREKALALAAQIKRVIAAQVGSELRCSIGIAPNDFLAKTATDMQKPDGCVVLETADLPQALFRLKLRDLCGIGAAMEQRLKRHGILTVEQLCTVDSAHLRRAWNGIAGELMYRQLRGEETQRSESARGSVGHSHVLPPELRNEAGAHAVLHRLLQKTAVRLRSYACAAGALHVKVKCVNRTRWAQTIDFSPLQDTHSLLDRLESLWKKHPAFTAAPLAVGVTLTNLCDARLASLDLFADDRHGKLDRVVDQLNQRFGKQTVYYGGAYRALTAAPLRIAFSHIPDLELEGEEEMGS